LIKLPFADPNYRLVLAERLRANVPGFGESGGWDGVVNIPTIIRPPGPDNPAKGKTFWSPAVTAGVTGGGALLLAVMAIAAYFCCKSGKKNHERRKRYGKPERANGAGAGAGSSHLEQHPPDQFQFSNDDNSQDGISVMMMDDGIVSSAMTKKTRLSADGSTLGYGDQRYVGIVAC
jgi:hypothetical protein